MRNIFLRAVVNSSGLSVGSTDKSLYRIWYLADRDDNFGVL